MNIAERFGASIQIYSPDAEAEGTFFVARPDDIDHTQFMVHLLGFIGAAERLVMHHRTGFAVVVLTHGRARRLSAVPWVETVGGVQFNPEQFAAVTGMDSLP